jgi:aspartate aminotransferase
VPCKAENNFMPTKEELASRITKKTKALILNSPNNPSGGVISRQQISDIASLISSSSIWAISDEIYEKLIFDNTEHISIASLSDDLRKRTIVISGASKGYAMTGWRVGVVGGEKTIINAMVKLQGQETTCLPEFIQDAAAFALRENDVVVKDMRTMLDAYHERRKLSLNLFSKLPDVQVFKPQGAFYIWADFSYYLGKPLNNRVVEDDMDFTLRMLKEAHVAAVPGSSFGGEGYLRFSIASSEDTIKKAVERIALWLS